jgi:hypothetical protein
LGHTNSQTPRRHYQHSDFILYQGGKSMSAREDAHNAVRLVPAHMGDRPYGSAQIEKREWSW